MSTFNKLFNTLSVLPVASKAEAIVASVQEGIVTILSSATGSGKTLYATTLLAEQSVEQVVVCVPRRFLAVNAAETVTELAGVELGQEVGYCVGKQSGEESKASHNTKLLFVTYGYAISSGLVNRAGTIVLDEVHEASMDMSIVRALLHRRLANGEQVKVLEMSATINSSKQAGYWGQVAPTEIFEVEGKTFDCDRRWAINQPHESVMDLINEGRKGILVFRPGVGEVKETAAAVEYLAKELKLNVEVSTIYGEMDSQERRKAVAKPSKGMVKVLVGTNVVESGANISWLDSGVSCGKGKELVARESGAVGLDLIDLSKWRLEQQEGRVKRFCEGVFILCSDTEWEDRSAETEPELKRLPLTELVMHCSAFGLKAEDMTFDVALEQSKVAAAEVKLQRLGLIDENCKLTVAGKFVSNMPVSPETGAALWYAKNNQCLGAALLLASVIEVGGVRKSFRYGHSLDNTSDWLDSLKAFEIAASERDSKNRKELMEQYNIGYKRFESVKAMYSDLKSRFNGDASSTMEAIDQQLRRCIAAGWIDSLFNRNGQKLTAGSYASSYGIGIGSAIGGCLSTDYSVAELRTITPRDPRKCSFTIMEKVTELTLEDLLAVSKFNGAVTVEKTREKVGYFAFNDVSTYKLFGEYEIAVVKAESQLTAEEEAEKATLEAKREEVIVQFASKIAERARWGVSEIAFKEEHFSLEYYSSSYSYTEEDVNLALEKHSQQIAEKRASLVDSVQSLAKRIEEFGVKITLNDDKVSVAGQFFDLSNESVNQLRDQVDAAERQRDAVVGRQRIETLNVRREELGMALFELRDDSYKLSTSWSGFYYYDLNQVAQYESGTEQQAERFEAEKQGRERLVVINQRLEALGRNALAIDSDGDIRWDGYKSIRNMDALDTIEADISRLEDEAKIEAERVSAEAEAAKLKAEKEAAEKAEAEIRYQSDREAGIKRLKTLNGELKALDWEELEVNSNGFYHDGYFFEIVDFNKISQLEVQVKVERKKRREEQENDARMMKQKASTDSISALLSKFGR